MNYDPNEPRDDLGRWTAGGAAKVLYPNHPTEQELEYARHHTGPAEVVAEGKRVTIYHEDGSVEIRNGGSIAWRNNNPGNLIPGKFATDHGAIGKNRSFAVFPDESTGTKAMDALLRTPKYQESSLNDTIKHWAPPQENNTTNYQRLARDAVGVDGDTALKNLSDSQFETLKNTIRRVESWQPGSSIRSRK